MNVTIYEMVHIRVIFVLYEMVHDYILMYDICIIWFGDYISSTKPICELLNMYTECCADITMNIWESLKIWE